MEKQNLDYVAFGQIYIDLITWEKAEPVFHLEKLEVANKCAGSATFFIRNDLFYWDTWLSTPERIKNLSAVWNFIAKHPNQTFIVATGNPRQLVDFVRKNKITLPSNMRITILYYDLTDLRKKIGWIYRITERFMVLPCDRKEE